MPNWCYNRVEIYGDETDQIKEVKKTLAGKETCFDFNNIVPMPDWKEYTQRKRRTCKTSKSMLGVKCIRLKEDAYANNTDTITGTTGVVIIGTLNGIVATLLQ